MTPDRKSKGDVPVTSGGKSVRVKVGSIEHFKEIGRKTDDLSKMASSNETNRRSGNMI